MDELNQENQDANEDEITHVDSEKNESVIEATATEGNITEESKQTEEETVQPKQENNFFAEENYYDSHPLPPQAPPQYRPPYPQQPQGYGQPSYPQQQYSNPYSQQAYRPQPQAVTPQNPYQPQQYNPQPYHEQYMPQQPKQQFTPPPNYPQQNYYAQPAPKEPEIDGKKKKRKGPVIAITLTILLLAGLILTFAILWNQDNKSLLNSNSTSEAQSSGRSEESTYQIPAQSKPNVDEKYTDEDGKYTTQGVAKVVSPSVVGVVIYGEQQSLTPTSQGSGIIISADGYIATNAHVVEGATAQKVILSDGKEYVATIVGRDSKSDLAVLKIEPEGTIVPAELGDSDELELGEQIITLGNPGGLANSFSGGFVSGLDRQIKSSDTGLAMNCIQTDAAVNPGNSGGPLVNMYGQVVGIVSSKYVATGYEGIGFAISINDALPIIQDIIGKGYVSDRVKIGIVFAELSETDAKMYEVVPGLYINQIDETCDIAKSGLQVYDIITEMNGQKVYNYDMVMKAIEGQKPGDTVTAKVYRKTIVGEVTEFEISFKLMEDTSGE